MRARCRATVRPPLPPSRPQPLARSLERVVMSTAEPRPRGHGVRARHACSQLRACSACRACRSGNRVARRL